MCRRWRKGWTNTSLFAPLRHWWFCPNTRKYNSKYANFWHPRKPAGIIGHTGLPSCSSGMTDAAVNRRWDLFSVCIVVPMCWECTAPGAWTRRQQNGIQPLRYYSYLHFPPPGKPLGRKKAHCERHSFSRQLHQSDWVTGPAVNSQQPPGARITFPWLTLHSVDSQCSHYLAPGRGG